MRDFYCRNKQFLDHDFIKMIFPYSGILYFVMNYRIKGTILNCKFPSYRLCDNLNVISNIYTFAKRNNDIFTNSLQCIARFL